MRISLPRYVKMWKGLDFYCIAWSPSREKPIRSLHLTLTFSYLLFKLATPTFEEQAFPSSGVGPESLCIEHKWGKTTLQNQASNAFMEFGF